VDSSSARPVVGAHALDAESREWLVCLGGTGRAKEAARGRLYDLLLRIALGEVHRRGGGPFRITGPELDDVAHHAAADALLAIEGKLGQFRGESRFTTWAYKFVMFEVSRALSRHYLRHPHTPMDAEDWERLPDQFGLDPARESEWRDLLAAVRRAVDDVLSDRQREVFIAIVLNAVPLDAVVAELGTNRNAIYKVMFDARRKIRAALIANGYADAEGSRRT
jgi:RNA polymerase sigma-70 factor, ECF subfamily